MFKKIIEDILQIYPSKQQRKVSVVCINRKSIMWHVKKTLPFYKNISRHPKGKDFKLNPYNSCIGNNMIKGSHMTVTWHIDGLKCFTKLEPDSQSLGKIFGDGLGLL